MKKNLLSKSFLLFFASMIVLTVQSQERSGSLYSVEPGDESPANSGSNSHRAAATNCTDKINYVGNTASAYVQVGGANYYRFPGVFQVYPEYTGSVVAVEFNAARFVGTTTCGIGIFSVNSSGKPVIFPQLASIVATITSNSNNLYTATFPTPVSVTGNYGFAVGIYVNGQQDSIKTYVGPPIQQWSTNYGFLATSPNNVIYSFPSYFSLNYDLNVLLRPIVRTSASAVLQTAVTSTGCALPVVYNFYGPSNPFPSYAFDPIINPSGSTADIDFGDMSPIAPVTFPSIITHSYTSMGNYVAQYKVTYVGWTSNCVETLTIPVVVNNPVPAFNYTVNGLTVNFDNTSLNMTGYSWNFGDLATSTKQQPGSHTYDSPGTYVVELEGTAPCGKVKHVQTIVVNNTGIGENNSGGHVSVFPNPAGNQLTLFTNSSAPASGIEIFNSIGSAVKVVNNPDVIGGSTSIYVGDLQKGVYFIRIKHKDGEVVKSFFKD